MRFAEFSPEGKRILTASSDGTARVWDAQTGQPLTEPLKHVGRVSCAQFSPDGRRVVIASYDATRADWGLLTNFVAQVWDAQTGRPSTEPIKHAHMVDCVQFSPDGRRIVTAGPNYTKTPRLSGFARVWDAQTGQALTQPLEQASSAQFSPDGKRILTAGDAVRGWDAQTGRPLTEPIKDTKALCFAQFSPDGRRIVTASSDLTAQVWDARTGQPLTEPLKYASWSLDVHGVSPAQFSPDGMRVLTASSDAAQVWDAWTGRPLTEPLKLAAKLKPAGFFVPDYRRIDSGVSCQFSPDGKRVLLAWGDTARVWDVAPPPGETPAWLIELATAVCGKVLSARGVLEYTNQARVLRQLRQTLNEASASDDWVTWGRWFLADPATRTISPFSKITVPQYIENRIRENTADSLAEAERLAVGNAKVLDRISKARTPQRGMLQPPRPMRLPTPAQSPPVLSIPPPDGTSK